MIILLNGPLGIGKTTLAEALMESIDQCVMLDGDFLVAVNPEPSDSLELLHSTVALLVAHYQRSGYKHFVIPYIWTTQEDIDDLRRRLSKHDADFHCFLLTLPVDENLARISRRASVRALDEYEFELRTVAEERDMLGVEGQLNLGEPIDVSASPSALVDEILRRLGLSNVPVTSMKSEDFDKKFDDGKEDIIEDLDLSSARRVNYEQKRINVDIPS